MSTEKTASPTLSTPLTLIPSTKLQRGSLLGSGGYGDVYRAQWQGIDVALKQLRLNKLSVQLLDDFKREATIMATCQFPYVVQLYGACMEEGHYAMVMEYLSKGSLYDVLHNPKEPLLWHPVRWQIALDIGKGLSYLHEKNIVHRDLKSLNVLLDAEYHAKITDFGLAKIKSESSSVSTKAKQGMGTTRWRAPELFKRGNSPNKPSDVYAYGMVLWEIASRQLPFSDESDEQTVISWIKDGEQETLPQDCPEGYGELVKACWNVAPDQRPSAADLTSRLEAIKPTEENPVHHPALNHFQGEDSDKHDQRIAVPYTTKTLRYLLPMLPNEAHCLVYVQDETKAPLKASVRALCLLSKALGRPAILVLPEAASGKAMRALLLFSQDVIVIEVSPASKLTPIQKGTLEELQDEQVIERLWCGETLLSTPLAAAHSGPILVQWLLEVLQTPFLEVLKGLNTIEQTSPTISCALSLLRGKPFNVLNSESALKTLRQSHGLLLAQLPARAVAEGKAVSEEAFVQGCHDALLQRFLPQLIAGFEKNKATLMEQSKALRCLLWDTRDAPLIRDFKALSQQLTGEKALKPLLSGDVKRGKVLGEGNFGAVYEGRWMGTPVAIKVLKSNAFSQSELTAAQYEFKNEMALLSLLKHPRILTCYGMCADPLQAVLERLSGSLADELREGESPRESMLTWKVRQQMLLDMAEAVAHLHTHQIVHGDLRACNFLVDEQQRIKLGDFGLAKQRAGNMTAINANIRHQSKLAWSAPELLPTSGKRTFASDVYSFGMVMWELLTGYEPFCSSEGRLEDDVITQRIKDGKVLNSHDLPADTPAWVSAMFKACLASNPKDRPSMQAMVQVLFFVVEKAHYAERYPASETIQTDTWVKGMLALVPVKPKKVAVVDSDGGEGDTETESDSEGVDSPSNVSYVDLKLRSQEEKLTEQEEALKAKELEIEALKAQLASAKQVEKPSSPLVSRNATVSSPSQPVQPITKTTTNTVTTPVMNTKTPVPGVFKAEPKRKEGASDSQPVRTVPYTPNTPKISDLSSSQTTPKVSPSATITTTTTTTTTVTTTSTKVTGSLPSVFQSPPKATSSCAEQVETMSQSVQSKINPKDLSALLKWVTEGHLVEVEALLKKNSTLGLGTGTVTDRSDRTFKNITALHYAAWSLDAEMAELIIGYIGAHNTSIQLNALANEPNRYSVYGSSYDYTPLVTKTQTYVDNYNKWDADKCLQYWKKEVGGEQRKCPAWLIYAWSEEGSDVAWTKKDANRKIKREYDKNRLDWWFTEKYNNGSGVGTTWAARVAERLVTTYRIAAFALSDKESVSILGKTRGETLQRLRANADSQLNQTTMGFGKGQ